MLDDRGNLVDFSADDVSPPKEVKVSGDRNALTAGARATLAGLCIIINGSNNKIIIGSDCVLNGRIVMKGKSQTVRIGNATTFQGVSILVAEGQDVTIGEDCMFSKRIEIRTSDSHSILDRVTRKRLNAPGPVHVGDRVWVGMEAVLSKGTRVPGNSVIAAKAFVNKHFSEEFVLIGGVPAVVIKTGIDWDRKLLPMAKA